VPIQNSLAARPAEEVAEAARSAGLSADVSSSVEQALRTIAARDWPAPPRILICGSLYLAGEVLSANGTPPT
jgi:dihydrofolate synthase/folylpolyglutamate synthase